MDYSGELAINIVFVVYCCVARLKGHKAPVTACRFVPERDLLITRYLHTMLLSSHVVDSVNSVYSMYQHLMVLELSFYCVCTITINWWLPQFGDSIKIESVRMYCIDNNVTFIQFVYGISLVPRTV